MLIRNLLANRDLVSAIALAGAGGTALAVGVRRPGALSMLPAMDGCITLAAVGLVLAVLGGVPYRKAIFAMLPVVAISFVAARNYGTPPLAVLGLEAILFSLVGLAVVAYSSRGAADAAPVRPDRRAAEPHEGRRWQLARSLLERGVGRQR